MLEEVEFRIAKVQVMGKKAKGNNALSPSSLVDSIHGTYESLSPQERGIADFILGAPGDVCMYSASELARLNEVSNSTITRFVRRVGFANYEEMRLSARMSRKMGSPLFLASSRGPDDFDSELLDRYLKSEQQSLANSLAEITPESLDEISTALLEARNLGFLGFRNSHFFAGYARWQFIQFRPHTRLIPGPGETIAERIADLNANDVVVVIGVRRIVGNLKRYMEALDNKGVRMLLLTDPSARVAPKYARWVITCQIENDYVFDSYAGVLGVIRLLAYETFVKSGKSGRAYLKAIEEQHSVLKEFE